MSSRHSRTSSIDKASSEVFDVCIIGGGVHGAAVAREAVLRGLKVILFEQNDFAFGSSSRSSKLLHGGLRYLENLEFSLLREALRERERMLKAATHLSRPLKFIFPIIPGRTRPHWQVRLGLTTYDLLAAGFEAFSGRRDAGGIRNHQRVAADSEEDMFLRAVGIECSSSLCYFDAQMEDTRIVVEMIVDAANEGATILNHAPVIDCIHKGESWAIVWEDSLNESKAAVARAKYIVNTAGPWTPAMDHLVDRQTPVKALYSRGTHLIYNYPWPDDFGLILPAEKDGRVYWILPFFNPWGKQTLVGTTDVAVDENESDPQPSDDEILLLKSFLKRDIPNSPLSKIDHETAFAGMRILQAPQGEKSISDVSRKEKYFEREAYCTFLGGKYTTARNTGCHLVDKAERFIRGSISPQQTVNRSLPGSKELGSRPKTELLSALQKIASTEDEKGLPEICISLFGNRAELLYRDYPADDSTPLAQRMVKLAIDTEFATSAEDVARRRLLTDWASKENAAASHVRAAIAKHFS